jgi:hypothetical protein
MKEYPIIAGGARTGVLHAVTAGERVTGTACGRIVTVVRTGTIAEITCERCVRHERTMGGTRY